jgi:small subunit ribosomal protein S19
MTRSSWKTPFVDYKLLNSILNVKDSPIKTTSRQTKILQSFVGLNIFVHTGLTYKKVYINEDMVGRKLGEFAYTRKIGNIHKKKDKKK